MFMQTYVHMAVDPHLIDTRLPRAVQKRCCSARHIVHRKQAIVDLQVRGLGDSSEFVCTLRVHVFGVLCSQFNYARTLTLWVRVLGVLCSQFNYARTWTLWVHVLGVLCPHFDSSPVVYIYTSWTFYTRSMNCSSRYDRPFYYAMYALS